MMNEKWFYRGREARGLGKGRQVNDGRLSAASRQRFYAGWDEEDRMRRPEPTQQEDDEAGRVLAKLKAFTRNLKEKSSPPAHLVLAGLAAFSLYSVPPRVNSYSAWNACNDELTTTTNFLRTKPAISWPGGKSRFLDRLLPLIPEHTCYCEPFGGGLAVFLAKPRSAVEIINDFNQELITFYRCVRFHPDVLMTELEFVLSSRLEFNDFRQQKGLTDLQRSARWYFRNKNCFGGANMDTFGFAVSSARSSREGRMEAIRRLSVRLDCATIENLDWKRCLELYDRPSTFFFLDPPYTECNAGMYDAWTTTDVQSLRQRLDRLRGKWLVTMNDTPAIRAVFEGCRIQGFTRARGIRIVAGETAKAYKELIIQPPV